MEKVVIIPPPILRSKFNASKFSSLQGLTAKMLRNTLLQDPEKKGEPMGTRSQFIRYSDKGRWVVEIHQYLRPDGTLGASGRPDPKRLRLEGIIYSVPPK